MSAPRTRRRATDVGDRRAWSPSEAAGMLGLPYETVLEEIRAKRLGALKVGRYYVIPDTEIERYLDPARLDRQVPA
ncbi:MAG TPA: excisionase family DNA-binding protein [Acidimicrobiia bacterium]|nr:excisionase family DNA-binding protein [Acidimicrobiia bacterium]